MRTLESIIIHCSATPNGRWTTVEDIDKWHGERTPPFQRKTEFMRWQQPRLKHIGYHFVVYTTGAVVSGRAIAEVGAHARGHNQTSIGVCMVGTDQYTTAQWQELKNLITILQNRYPQLRVLGHREVNPHKSCPGFDVGEWLANDMKPLPQHVRVL